jgi:hypothetical protein
VAALGDEEVGGLNVAVHNTLGMGGIESVGNLSSDLEQLFKLQGLTGYQMFERLSVEKFHGDKCLSMLIVDFVDGADVGVVQCGSSFGLALKAAESLQIVGYLFGQEFQGNKAAKLEVLSFVNYAHSPAAKSFDDAVMGDGLTATR